MRSRTYAAGAVLGLALSFFAATSASADDYCDYEDSTAPTLLGYEPSSITIGLSSVAKTFDVEYEDECELGGWLITGDRYIDPYVYDSSPTEVFNPSSLENSDAGKVDLEVRIYDEAYNTTTELLPFYLKRRTYITSFNAFPETGSRTKTITGTLKRANWDTEKYANYGSQTLEIQFKVNGGSYEKIGTVTAKSNGTFRKNVTIPKSGTLRTVYKGRSVSGAATGGGDAVKVG